MVVVILLVKDLGHIRLISFPNSLFIEEHCKVHIEVNYVHMEDNKEESIKVQMLLVVLLIVI